MVHDNDDMKQQCCLVVFWHGIMQYTDCVALNNNRGGRTSIVAGVIIEVGFAVHRNSVPVILSLLAMSVVEGQQG